MKTTLHSLLLFGLLSNPAYSELIFQWNDIDTPKEKRSGVEERIKNIALKYTDKKYAEYGEYNFVTSNEKYYISIVHDPYAAGFNPERRIQIGNIPDPLMEIIMVHEFAHAYDLEKGIDEIKMAVLDKNEITMPLIEGRATKKEYIYLQEIKDKIPEKYYKKLMRCVDKEDYYKTYMKRSLILLKWVEEVTGIKPGDEY